MSCTYSCKWLFLNMLLHTKEVIATPFLVYVLSLFIFSAFSLPALAKDFADKITVSEKNGIYYINASSDIAASDSYVRNVLTDYLHIYRLNDSIIESRILSPIDNDKVQVETIVQCCVPMFCKEVTRVEEISELDSGHIQTTIITDKSDFSSGSATWKIEAKGDTTHLTYQATLEPNFYIPPFVGTSLVIKNMRKEFNTTFNRIERIASINETRDWDRNYQFARAEKRQTDVKPAVTYKAVKKPKEKPCTSISHMDF